MEFSLKESNKKAIAYYRHSAEDKQENSVEIQREHTTQFAHSEGIEIIHEEVDEGKSGLLADRPGFNHIFSNWILNKDAPKFDYVLVYDVSRWGRFQNQDEAAYYEFVSRKEGKKVIYVTRGLPKNEDESLISHLYISIERFMAAEYSRQLSGKVFNGCVKISQQGYSAGGPPCYGMARLLLDVNKNPIRILKNGEHKQIANERVTFIPRNDQTVAIVRKIFKLFVSNTSPQKIVALLNNDNEPSPSGGIWNQAAILRILENEMYIGTRVYNKTNNRLKHGRRSNPRSQWVFCRNAFRGIVEQDIFEQAYKRLHILYKIRYQRRIIAHAKRHFFPEIKNFLHLQGLTPDQIYRIIHNFPLVCCFLENYNYSCNQFFFVVEPAMRRFEMIIGIAIGEKRCDPIQHVFIFPTKDLKSDGILFFSTQDSCHAKYLADLQKVAEIVKNIASILVT